MRRLRRAAALGGSGLLLAGSAFAADQIAGRDRDPASATVTIASSAPLFQEAGLVTGQTFERCTVLTNEGPQPADVTLFGTSDHADLSPYLDLDLVRGSMPDGGPAGDCTGFVADTDDYGSGAPGVVFRGTLASLPDADAGIADPTRWAVGERHAYLLRVHYTGQNAQQGLSTSQTFNWGVTPFDDRPPDPFVDPGTETPGTSTGASTGASAGSKPGDSSVLLGRSCTIVSFPARNFIGARAISRPVKVRKSVKKSLAALGSTSSDVISGGETPQSLGTVELERRAKLLAYTRKTAARRSPVLVVRIVPGKNGKIAVRVGLRKNTILTTPRRWRWVRMRVNASPTKSTLAYPFIASAEVNQLKLGYNQLDITLNRGKAADRVKGLPRLLRRSFAFIVGQPSTMIPGHTDCTLG